MLSFHEFQLCLARIAHDLHAKDHEKKDIDRVLRHFFAETIGIRKNDRVQSDPLPNINKKLYKRLENFYRDIEAEERGVVTAYLILLHRS